MSEETRKKLNLKACPFCGSAADFSAEYINGVKNYTVECGYYACNARTHGIAPDLEAAAEIWNTRIYEREVELKPCPFCGGDAKFVRAGAAYRKIAVECPVCKVKTPEADMKEKVKLIRAWNRRTDQGAVEDPF